MTNRDYKDRARFITVLNDGRMRDKGHKQKKRGSGWVKRNTCSPRGQLSSGTGYAVSIFGDFHYATGQSSCVSL